MKIALLGPPNSGKKTFFSLLTCDSPEDAATPATMHGLLKRKSVRGDGNSLTGIAPVHDERLIVLSKMFKPERTVFAENTIVLCPDIVSGGTDRKWLEPARKCDLLCVVARGFTCEGQSDEAGAANPERDRSNMESELLLADLELIEARLTRMEKEQRGSRARNAGHEKQVLLKIKTCLETEMRLCSVSIEPDEAEPIKSLGLLSLKPLLWIYNVDETELSDKAGSIAGDVFKVSCQIEQEIMTLGESEEQAAYLRDLGFTESGVDRLNRAAYDALGLRSFYTVGEDEVRAWTVHKGATAPVAAGKVHSDIQRGFIRVEVTKYDDLTATGSEAAAKAAGKVRVKGKDYVMEDGDICHFLFNV